MFATFLMQASTACAVGSLPNQPLGSWQPNGPVNAVAAHPDGASAYIGGSFGYIGPVTGHSVRLDGGSGDRSGAWPAFEGGAVHEVVADGSGGWIVGGSFTTVDGAPRRGLARVTSVGTLDAFWGDPEGPDGAVTALAMAGDRVFVGGRFGSYGGSRTGTGGIMALAVGTGALDESWTDGAGITTSATGAAVHDIEASTASVYVAGAFDGYGGQPVANIMRLDASTGDLATGWLAGGANGPVRDLVLDAGGLLVAGEFTLLGGLERQHLGAVGSDGAILAWKPTVAGPVRSIAATDSSVYASGTSTLGGGPWIAAIQRASGDPVAGWTPDLAWEEGATTGAERLEVIDGAVYVGGRILRVDGSVRRGAAKLHVDTGALVAGWNAHAGAPALAFAGSGTDVLVGGLFRSVGGVERNHLAQVDLDTGVPRGWAPIVGWPVRTLEVSATTVYAGGGHLGAAKLTAFEMSMGVQAPGWTNPTFSGGTGSIEALRISAGKLFVGGSFGIVNGTTRQNLISLDQTSGAESGPMPSTNGMVTDIELSSDGLTGYLAGEFTYAGSNAQHPRNRLAAFPVNDWSLVSWNPNANGPVRDIAVRGATAYLVGSFTTLGGVAVSGAAAVDATPTVAAPVPGAWVPAVQPSGSAAAVHAPTADAAFVGGGYSSIAGAARPGLAQLDAAGTPTSWMPRSPNGPVRTIGSTSSTLLVGGDAGIAIYRSLGTATSDVSAPFAQVLSISESAGANDPSDGTHVLAGGKVVVRADGQEHQFAVKVRAHDTVTSTNPTYTGTSGLDEVQWPSIPSALGSSSPAAGAVAGSQQGLHLRCFNTWRPEDATASADGLDRDIAYDYDKLTNTGRRPDVVATLPGTLASRAGVPDTGTSDGLDSFSCRWTGFVVGLKDDAGDYTFQSNSDQGFRARVGAGTGWSTISDWDLSNGWSAVSPATPILGGGARSIIAEWWEGSGTGRAALHWQPPSTAAMQLIPEAAFVTNVAYERTYRLTAPLGSSGSAQLEVVARDRATNQSSATLGVATDGAGPHPATSFTTDPPAGWTIDDTPTIAIQDGAGDAGEAGLHDRTLERRSATLDPATGACSSSPTDWIAVAGPFTDTIAAPDSRVIQDTAYPAGASALAAGCYQYRYVSRDNVGNETIDHPGGAFDANAWIRIDPVPPSGGSMDYVGGLTNADPVLVQFTLPSDAQSGIASSKLERLSAAYANGSCATTWTAAFVTADPTSPYADTAAADGSCNRYRVSAKDRAGNEHAVAWGPIFMVDRAAPASSLATTPSSPVHGTVTVGGSATDTGSGAVSVDVGFTGATSDEICQAAPVDASGNWTCSWDTTPLGDGPYSIWVVARDAAGNASSANWLDVDVDNTPPQVAPTVAEGASPQYQHVVAGLVPRVWINPVAAGGFVVDAGATDSGGVQSVTFPSLWGTTSTTATAAPFQQAYSWPVGATAPGVSVITAFDNAGHSATGSFDVQVDTTGPVGGSISYPDGVASVATITSSAGSDAGSGPHSSQLQRRAAPTLTADSCDTTSWGTWGMVGPQDPPATFTDSTVERATCYQYRLQAHDNVANVSTFEDAALTLITASPGISITESGTSTSVTEAGASDTYVVQLRAAPAAGTTVTVDITGDAQVTAAPARLTFTDASWNTPQQVTVAAVDDQRDQVPDTRMATVTHAISSSDPGYAGMADVLHAVHVVDDDVAQVSISPTSGLAVSEAGGTSASYQVRLATQPTGTVTVAIDAGSQLRSTPTTLSFTATSWSTAQTVTVVAVDDPDIEGPHAAAVAHAVSAGDPADVAYAGVAASTVNVSIDDDDAAGLEIATSPAPIVDEAAPTTTEAVRVRLRARPAGSVTVAATGVAGQLGAAPASLTFTPASWNQYQSVAVSAVDDTRAEPNPHAAQLELKASSDDPNFSSLAARVVAVEVRDNDPARLVARPGTGWTLSDAGRLQLRETDEPPATIRIRAVGDPTSDVVVTPVLSPADQLVVSPRSATIPGGSHDHVVSFTVRAVDDRVAEASPHPARISWRVATTDPLYGTATLSAMDVEIADGAETATRETPTQPVGESTPTQPTSTEPTPPPGGQTATSDPAPTRDATSTTPAQPNEPAPDGTTVASQGGDDERAIEPSGGHDDAANDERSSGGAVKRLRNWARENKAAAGIGASAAGTAALWAAKPLLVAGKALGSAGMGLPNAPTGLTQARHLLKLRRRKHQQKFWRRVLAKLRRRSADEPQPRQLRRPLRPPVERDPWSRLTELDPGFELDVSPTPEFEPGFELEIDDHVGDPGFELDLDDERAA